MSNLHPIFANIIGAWQSASSSSQLPSCKTNARLGQDAVAVMQMAEKSSPIALARPLQSSEV